MIQSEFPLPLTGSLRREAHMASMMLAFLTFERVGPGSVQLY